MENRLKINVPNEKLINFCKKTTFTNYRFLVQF